MRDARGAEWAFAKNAITASDDEEGYERREAERNESEGKHSCEKRDPAMAIISRSRGTATRAYRCSRSAPIYDMRGEVALEAGAGLCAVDGCPRLPVGEEDHRG